MRFDGKVAIVTGSNTGIGEAIARALAAEGAAVCVTGRRDDQVQRVVTEITAAGGRAIGVAADVSSEADVRQIVERTRSDFGPIDIAVNNAGIRGPLGSILELSREGLESAITTNVIGTFLLTKAVVPDMIAKKRGWIVNVGSIVGKRPAALRLPYATSKMALVGFTRTLAHELALHNINVNLVSPGMVETPAGQNVSSAFDALKERDLGGIDLAELSALSGRPTPLSGGLIQPAEVADLVLFLCSDAARRITGQDLDISAGAVMY